MLNLGLKNRQNPFRSFVPHGWSRSTFAGGCSQFLDSPSFWTTESSIRGLVSSLAVVGVVVVVVVVVVVAFP